MKPFLALLLAASILASADAQKLFPGDAAPSITVGEWVKGSPISSFKKGEMYVVEFWATWCGPCKISIPHLTELAHQYKDKVTFIGVSIAEVNTDAVAPFVKKMGNQMDYNVAVDKQENTVARSGYMSKHWLEAAGLNSIPVAFVIGKTGKIDFIGDPEELDSMLALMVIDKWDAARFAKKWKVDQQTSVNEQKVFGQLKDKMSDAIKHNNKAALYKAFDNYLKKTLEYPSKSWPAVNETIWAFLADPDSKAIPAELKDPAFGITWMEKLNKHYNEKEPAFLDTLAWLYHAAGDDSKAVETETKAIGLLNPADPSRGDYEKALSEFNQ